LVFLRGQNRIIESGQEEPSQEIGGHLTAAAMPEQNLLVLAFGEWTGSQEVDTKLVQGGGHA
jgi:hypothetical protein